MVSRGEELMIFLCGKKYQMGELTKGDYREVKNFSKFLQGKGHRCPLCLHKAKNHRKKGGCVAVSGTCTCSGTREWVRQWHRK
jgi:hypothetical protein